jgi:hypothetical protein
MIGGALQGPGGLVLAYGATLLAAGMVTFRRGRSWGSLARVLVLALPATLVALLAATMLRALLEISVPAGRGLVTLACLVAAGVLVGFRLGRDGAGPAGTVLRGARLASAARRPGPGNLSLAGVPVTGADEVRHFKCLGTTGTGKSTAIRELVDGALARGDRAVIADADGSAVVRLYDPGRGDVILHPFDARARRWDPFLELRAPHDPEQLARSLVGEGQGSEQSWRRYAQGLCADLLRRLETVGGERLGDLHRLLTSAEVAELRVLLEGTSTAALLAEGNERMLASVRAVAAGTAASLGYLAAQPGPGFSVRDWVERGRGVLFLPYRADEIAALRSIISTWLRTAIFQVMSQGEGDARLWFVVDELDALGAIDGLPDALARLRKFGGRMILGFQSIAQVSGTYGDAAARTIVENCASSLILRCSASDGGGTARFASTLIGEREVLRTHESESFEPGFFGRRRSRTFSQARTRESAVLPAEIERLADLEGYLKLASDPDWRRVRLVPGAAR